MCQGYSRLTIFLPKTIFDLYIQYNFSAKGVQLTTLPTTVAPTLVICDSYCNRVNTFENFCFQIVKYPFEHKIEKD